MSPPGIPERSLTLCMLHEAGISGAGRASAPAPTPARGTVDTLAHRSVLAVIPPASALSAH